MCPTAIGLGTACATVGVGCDTEVELGISNRLRGRWRCGEEAGSLGLFWGDMVNTKNEVISYVPQEIRPYFFIHTYMDKYIHFLCFIQEPYKYYMLHDILAFFLQTRGSRGFSVLMLVLSQVPFGRCCGR